MMKINLDLFEKKNQFRLRLPSQLLFDQEINNLYLIENNTYVNLSGTTQKFEKYGRYNHNNRKVLLKKKLDDNRTLLIKENLLDQYIQDSAGNILIEKGNIFSYDNYHLIT